MSKGTSQGTWLAGSVLWAVRRGGGSWLCLHPSALVPAKRVPQPVLGVGAECPGFPWGMPQRHLLLQGLRQGVCWCHDRPHAWQAWFSCLQASRLCSSSPNQPPREQMLGWGRTRCCCGLPGCNRAPFTCTRLPCKEMASAGQLCRDLSLSRGSPELLACSSSPVSRGGWLLPHTQTVQPSGWPCVDLNSWRRSGLPLCSWAKNIPLLAPAAPHMIGRGSARGSSRPASFICCQAWIRACPSLPRACPALVLWQIQGALLGLGNPGGCMWSDTPHSCRPHCPTLPQHRRFKCPWARLARHGGVARASSGLWASAWEGLAHC